MPELRNFSFVIEGVLAGSAHPAHVAEDAAALDAMMRGLGIGAVCSLDEAGIPASLQDGSDLKHLHIQVPDFHPPSMEQIEQFVKFVDDNRAEGRASLAHCYAGMGRTGTMIACYLLKENPEMTADEAIYAVRRLRPGSIETYSQEDVIHAWARRIRK